MKGLKVMYQNGPYANQIILVGFVRICFMLIHEQGLNNFMLARQLVKYLTHQLKVTRTSGTL
jgi:hypothetical protein